MKIIIEPAVDQKLEQLIDILLYEGYFDFVENALAYVQGIYDFIDTIPRQAIRPIRNTNPVFYYCQYRPNKRTSWYIIYEVEGEDYLIRNVLNNHSSDYDVFIAELR